MKKQAEVKAEAINEEALIEYVSQIKFSKTNSQTYSELGASLSSGDVRAKLIYNRLLETEEVKEAKNYNDVTFNYVIYDIGFEYNMKENDNVYRIKGILSTSRSIHLILDETAPF